MVGYIYILTNPSFPEYVKIGYAQNVEQRLDELNRSTAVPFSFRIYATYEVDSALSDKKLHSILDKLNPELRSTEEINGKKRIREFYAMTPEDAYSILEAIAEINDYTSRLKKWNANAEEQAEENLAQEFSAIHQERVSPFTFTECGIQPGAVLTFWKNMHEETGITCTVSDDKHVEYDGRIWSLTGLVKHLLNTNKALAGPRYFKYQNQWLNEIRFKK